MPRKAKKRVTGRYSPTQKDIAEALGLAQSTVAMALSSKHDHKLLAETVERVRSYAKKVGYHPQRYAQLMQGGSSRIIGVVARLNIYAANHELISLLSNELTGIGYRIILVDPSWFGDNHELVCTYLLDHGVEGVILCNLTQVEDAHTLYKLLPSALPKVSLQSSLEPIPNIWGSIESAFYALTRLHLALGSRRLALLLTFRDKGYLAKPAWTVTSRVKGFARAIQEVGGRLCAEDIVREMMELPKCHSLSQRDGAAIIGEIIQPERLPTINNAYENGYHEMMGWIDRDDLPDSVICANDDHAIGVLGACAQRGVEVPATLKVSGHDDTLPGRYATVPLSTVRIGMKAMAQHAARSIIELVNNPTSTAIPAMTNLPNEIIVKRSMGEPEVLRALSRDPAFQEIEGNRIIWPDSDSLDTGSAVAPNKGRREHS